MTDQHCVPARRAGRWSCHGRKDQRGGRRAPGPARPWSETRQLAVLEPAGGHSGRAYALQRSQDFCCERLEPPQAQGSNAQWGCSSEQNRFDRNLPFPTAGYIKPVHFSANGQRGGAVGAVGPDVFVIATRDDGQS
jgi:hypothetical protein